MTYYPRIKIVLGYNPKHDQGPFVITNPREFRTAGRTFSDLFSQLERRLDVFQGFVDIQVPHKEYTASQREKIEILGERHNSGNPPSSKSVKTTSPQDESLYLAS